MMGFIISKMNLLIFVTAIFVIVTYFTFGIADLMLSQRADFVAENYSKEAAAIINSSSAATENILTLPPEIEYFGGRKFFYVMKISYVQGEELDSSTGERVNHLIFSIASRKDREQIIASKRIDTQAEPHLFQQIQPAEVGIEEATGSPTQLTIDPQSAFRMDSFIVVKSTALDPNTNVEKEYVFISACSSGYPGAETCIGNKIQLHSFIPGPYWQEDVS